MALDGQQQIEKSLDRVVSGIKTLMDKEGFLSKGGLFFFETQTGVCCVGSEFKSMSHDALAEVLLNSLVQIYGEEFLDSMHNALNASSPFDALSFEGELH